MSYPKEANITTGRYENRDQCGSEPMGPADFLERKEFRFLQVDKRIKETENEIEYMTKILESKKNYLKQLTAVRKIVTPADEAKIQALISAGLL